MAQHHGWTCVTNDKRLRRACAEVEVPTVWGLELVIWLVEAKALTATAAQEIAEAIRAANPGYVTDAVMSRFAQKVRAVGNKRGRR
jgi:hypothetical protein